MAQSKTDSSRIVSNTPKNVRANRAGKRVVPNKGARKELEKAWSKFPSAERSQCVATMAKGGSPSYVELAVGLDMM